MRYNIAAIALAAAVAATAIGSALSPAAAAEQLGAARAAAAHIPSGPLAKQSKTQQNCSGVLSAYEASPAMGYVVSGQFQLVNQLTNTASACAHAAMVQYHYQYQSSGWDPATTCTRATNPGDTMVVFMTYVWGTNPSTRINGYAVVCNAQTPLANVLPL
jgi:hypothetical protein